MNIFVYSREEIEAGIIVRSDYVVISVGDPDKPRPKVKKQSGLRDVLFLAFHDAEPSASLDIPADIRLMSAEDAAQIRDFVHKHKATIGAIVIHCEQGMSRSPAIAAAISQALDLDSRRFLRDYTPNQHVYHTVLDAFKRP